MSYQTGVPHDDYAAGFETGFRAIRGDDARLPILTAAPQISIAGLTRFLVGVRAGLESAGVDIDKPELTP
jgi:hypothetical protein